MIKDLEVDNFEKEIANADIAIVDFWASWCAPCRMQSAVIDELAEELNNVSIFKVNIDKEGELAKKFNVFSIPTLIFFNKGIQKETVVGLHDEEEIKSILKSI